VCVTHKVGLTICPLFNFELKEESEQEFQISDQIRLRRMKTDELAKMKKLPFSYFLGESYALLNVQTFVFEIKSDNFQDADRLVYEVLLAMRLFKTGSVFCKHFWILENSKIRQFFSINPPIPWAKSNYLLSIDEIDEIKKLLEKIIQIELGKNKSFRVVCERFSRSFEERRDNDKVIDLAIAFESLFTDENTSRSNVMGELIGLGCSMLIGTNQKERDEIKQFLIKAFTIRNKIIHGSEVKTPLIINNQKYQMSDVSSQLREFLRASIKKLI
jgi:hypothetical protein